MMKSGIVEGYNHEGMGVVRSGEEILFVPGALLGEEVRVRPTARRKGKVIWGEIAGLAAPSPHRRQPPCPHWMRCGGCQLLHASYAHQLEIKREILKRAFAPLRKYDADILDKLYPILPAPEPFGYRNKGVFALGRPAEAQLSAPAETVFSAFPPVQAAFSAPVEAPSSMPGQASPPRLRETALGFYGRHSRVPAGHGCPALFSRQVGRLLDSLASWFKKTGVRPGVHHVLIRESKSYGNLILVFIGERKPAWLPAFLTAFTPSVSPSPSGSAGPFGSAGPSGSTASFTPSASSAPSDPFTSSASALLSGIGWLSAPDKEGPTVSGRPETLRGSLDITELLHPGPPSENAYALRFLIGPDAFFQVNTRQAEALYRETLNACALSGGETVWDIYCGSGTISLYLARSAKAVLGVELNESAVQNAWANARANDEINDETNNGTSDKAGDAASPPLSRRLCFLAGDAEKLAPALIGRTDVLPALLRRQEKLRAGKDGLVRPLPADLIKALNGKAPEVVVLDPPAKGARPAVLDAILAARPQKIAYVSCDPATLARDLQRLLRSGKYRIGHIRPVDMFPQTSLVESLVLLRRISE